MNIFAQALSAALELAVAAKTVAENGEPVGFLYREAPVFEHDSGWRFFSGGESDEYAADPANFTVVPVADIVKTNPETAPLMQEAAGAWEIGEDGAFHAVEDWQPQE